MTIETGLYIISNAWHKTLASLPESRGGATITATNRQTDAHEQWHVSKLRNGNYTIKSASNMFAVANDRAQVGDVVSVRSSPQEWVIQETPVTGHFTIATLDDHLFWGFQDAQTTTPLGLAGLVSDNRNAWVFKKTTLWTPPPHRAAPAPSAIPPGYYNPGGGSDFGPNVPIPTWR